jgi:hypothetical protein
MKTYEQFITEAAVATRKKPTRKEKAEFADKFNQVLHSKVTSNLRGGNRDWRLIGHNPGVRYGTSKAIEAMKEKVFGKRRKGTSDLLFMHKQHGIITHPAIGDTTHHDVLDGGGSKRKGVKVNKKIAVKVREDDIIGQGRIEHHEGGGGIISYDHRGMSPQSSAIRTIARAYPKYKIHDGQGNLLENWSYAHDFHEMPNSEKQKYVYHVTTASRAAKIVKGGLKPRSPKGRTNYPSLDLHTRGHAFVTNHHGVNYWKDQTAHAVNRRKREVDERDYEHIHVIKFPIANLRKSARRRLKVDVVGTEDARMHDEDPMIDPSSYEGSTALKTKVRIRESLYNRETKDGWQHSRALGRRRWTKGSHSVERQGKRGWTVYDWHNNRELHVAKTAREAKGWSDLNRKEGTKQETINIRPWTA